MMTVPIIIDFEASGFGAGSYPIEVGFSGRHGPFGKSSTAKAQLVLLARVRLRGARPSAPRK